MYCRVSKQLLLLLSSRKHTFANCGIVGEVTAFQARTTKGSLEGDYTKKLPGFCHPVPFALRIKDISDFKWMLVSIGIRVEDGTECSL